MGRSERVDRGAVARGTRGETGGTQARGLIARVARVEVTREVLDDFERFLEHMDRFNVVDGPTRISEIVQAFQILTHSPLIGRPVNGGKR